MCSACGSVPVSHVSVNSAKDGLCWPCRTKKLQASQIAKEAAELLSNLDPWVEKQMREIGLCKRELKADRDKVQKSLKFAMPRDVIDEILAGRIPEKGFGIGGITDGGKTMAICSILKIGAVAYAREHAPTKGHATEYHSQITFVSWPDEVAWFRANGREQGLISEEVHRLSVVPLLVLDDLGRERIKGCYVDDWAANQLDLVVSYRHRNEKPIIWTTNVPEISDDGRDLLSIYGAALVRRLTADNPLHWIGDLKPCSR